VFTVLKVIEKEDTEKISPEERERITMSYLMTCYGSEDDFLNIFTGNFDPAKKVVKRKPVVKEYKTQEMPLPSYL